MHNGVQHPHFPAGYGTGSCCPGYWVPPRASRMASCNWPSDGPPPLVPISPGRGQDDEAERRAFEKAAHSTHYVQQPSPHAKSIAYPSPYASPADRTQAPVQPSGGRQYFHAGYNVDSYARYHPGSAPGGYPPVQANCFAYPMQNSEYQRASYSGEFFQQPVHHQYAPGTFQNYAAFPQQGAFPVPSQRQFHVAPPVWAPSQFQQQQQQQQRHGHTGLNFTQPQQAKAMPFAPSAGVQERMADDSSSKRAHAEQPADPVAKSRRLSRDDVDAADRGAPSDSLVPYGGSGETGDESLKLQRFRDLLDNPLVIQDLVLGEKKLISALGSNHLGIELDAGQGRPSYQTIDFVRFHRIVASGRVSVRVRESTPVGPVVFVVHPSITHCLERLTADFRECASVHPAVDELLRPLESTECFVRYALLVNRRPLCWELAGFLGPLPPVEGGESEQDEEESTPIGSPSPGPSEETPAEAAVEASIVESSLPPEDDADVDQESADRLAPEHVYVCKFCDKSFAVKNSYQKHLWTHKKVQGNFRCNSCGKEFLSRKTFYQHRLTHSADGVARDHNGNSTGCQICKKAEGCSCRQEESDVELDPEARPVELVTLEKLRNLLASGKLSARLSERHAGEVIVARPADEGQLAGESTDIRLVEDVGRFSKAAAELVSPRPLAQHPARCAMLVYDRELLCWKLAGCLEPQASPSCSSDDAQESKSDGSDALFSPGRGVDPSSMLECVVENSPEKTVAVESPPSRPDSDEAYYPAFFANPLGEQSLEDVALSHLISMIPQQLNERVFDLLDAVELPPVQGKKHDTHNFNKSRICKLCFKVFGDLKSFVEHKVSHDPSLRIHECPHCNYVTVNRSNLSQHVKRHLPKSADV